MTRQAIVLKVAVSVLTGSCVMARAEVAAPTQAQGHYEAFMKNRYLTIDPTAGGANLGKAFAIRVTLTDSLEFAAAEGMTWWVGEPNENCFAGLVDSESTRNWDACQALFIGDCIGFFNGDIWTPPQGVTNHDDTTATLRTYQNRNATHVSVTDLHPRVVNRVVNFDDVFVSIKAFQGYHYPFGCPDDPCWDKLVSPCP